MSDLLGTSDAAHILGLSEAGVRKLEVAGTLAAQKDSKGRRLFNRKDVEQLARDRKRQRSAKKGNTPAAA